MFIIFMLEVKRYMLKNKSIYYIKIIGISTLWFMLKVQRSFMFVDLKVQSSMTGTLVLEC